MADDTASFWTFSLSLYARHGVPEACLALQDRFGWDTNMALWCLWLGVGGRALDETSARAAIAASAPWRDRAVRPLRAIRRDLKGGVPAAPAGPAAAVRDQIKAAELAAEQVQHAILEGLALGLPAATPGGGLAAQNLAAYATAENVPADPECIDMLLSALR